MISKSYNEIIQTVTDDFINNISQSINDGTYSEKFIDPVKIREYLIKATIEGIKKATANDNNRQERLLDKYGESLNNYQLYSILVQLFDIEFYTPEDETEDIFFGFRKSFIITDPITHQTQVCNFQSLMFIFNPSCSISDYKVLRHFIREHARRKLAMREKARKENGEDEDFEGYDINGELSDGPYDDYYEDDGSDEGEDRYYENDYKDEEPPF